MVKYVGVKG